MNKSINQSIIPRRAMLVIKHVIFTCERPLWAYGESIRFVPDRVVRLSAAFQRDDVVSYGR